MSYLSDLPLPDVTIREGDSDAIDFTLLQADGVTPVDLTSRIVELRLRAFRGSQVAVTYRSDGTSPAIVISTPVTAGAIKFTMPSTPTLSADAGLYRAYFAVYENATPTTNPKTVPQPRDFWVEMMPEIA